ncbi:MAG: FixH family protein [Acidobacteriota bacterium]|nr:FixH family protein [Acidobacteriota bacterium]
MKKISRIVLLAGTFTIIGCQQTQVPAERSVAAPTPQAQGNKTAIIAERVEGTSPYKVAVALDPAQPVSQKPVTFRFTVADAAGKPAAGLNAGIALVMPIMDMGKNEFPAKETAPGVYEGSGAFTMDDEWEIFLTLQHGKDKPAKHVFNVRVAE